MAGSDTLEKSGTTNPLSWARSLDEPILNDKSLFDTLAMWRLTDGLHTANEEWSGDVAAYLFFQKDEGHLSARYFSHQKDQNPREWVNDSFYKIDDLDSRMEQLGLPSVSQEMKSLWELFS